MFTFYNVDSVYQNKKAFLLFVNQKMIYNKERLLFDVFYKT